MSRTGPRRAPIRAVLGGPGPRREERETPEPGPELPRPLGGRACQPESIQLEPTAVGNASRGYRKSKFGPSCTRCDGRTPAQRWSPRRLCRSLAVSRRTMCEPATCTTDGHTPQRRGSCIPHAAASTNTTDNVPRHQRWQGTLLHHRTLLACATTPEGPASCGVPEVQRDAETRTTQPPKGVVKGRRLTPVARARARPLHLVSARPQLQERGGVQRDEPPLIYRAALPHAAIARRPSIDTAPGSSLQFLGRVPGAVVRTPT